MSKLYKIIPFNVRHGNCGGSLVQFQQGIDDVNALPFEIGKVLVMSDIKPDDVRGNHAHYQTEEILVALTGGCTVEVDDGKGSRESVRLLACESSEMVECERDFYAQLSQDSVESSAFLYPFQDETGSLDLSGIAARSQNKSLIANNSDIKGALLLYPHIWRTMRDFEPDTTLMVVANIKYNETDYIRDRVEFERIAQTWSGLGGSAE